MTFEFENSGTRRSILRAATASVAALSFGSHAQSAWPAKPVTVVVPFPAGGGTDLPWGMVFPHSGSMLPRHPSQVYQFLMEGLLLFVLLWLYARKPRKMGQVSGAFLVGYGVFRFIAEFFREPDDFLGILALDMSMGQWLCVPMIVGGVGLWVWASKRPLRK